MAIYKQNCHVDWCNYYIEAKPVIRTVRKPDPKKVREEQDKANILALKKAFKMV